MYKYVQIKLVVHILGVIGAKERYELCTDLIDPNGERIIVGDGSDKGKHGFKIKPSFSSCASGLPNSFCCETRSLQTHPGIANKVFTLSLPYFTPVNCYVAHTHVVFLRYHINW